MFDAADTGLGRSPAVNVTRFPHALGLFAFIVGSHRGCTRTVMLLGSNSRLPAMVSKLMIPLAKR